MTDNNRPVQPQTSRFGDLNEERPDETERVFREKRSSAGGRPSFGGRPSSGGRPSAGGRPSVGSRTASSGWHISPDAPGSRLPRGFLPLLGVCIVILALGLVLQAAMPNGFISTGTNDNSERPVAAQVSEIHGEGPVRLNEIMSANGGVLVDAGGATPDWIEVANIGNRPVNLQGYILAKSAKAGNVFVFPDLILQAGECTIVYADSTLQAEQGEELHAPFRLSSGGDVLMLFNNADVAVDTVNIPALSENEAYVRRDRNTWAKDSRSTPGLLNTEENYQAMTSVVQSANVQLAETVASSTRYGLDENGVAQDYVILRNISSADVDISGWYLSDNPQLPRLWKFPSGVVVPAGGTLLVHCSGMNRLENKAHLHTGFRLSTEGESLILSNANGQPVDSAAYDLLKTDTAYIRGSDGSWSVGTPTA